MQKLFPVIRSTVFTRGDRLAEGPMIGVLKQKLAAPMPLRCVVFFMWPDQP
jgi:hypothetical protein